MAYYGSSKYQYETSPRKIKPEYEQIKKKYPKKSSAKRNNSKKNTQNRSKVNTNTNTINSDSEDKILSNYIIEYTNGSDRNIKILYSYNTNFSNDYLYDIDSKITTINGIDLKIYKYKYMYFIKFNYNNYNFYIETSNITLEELSKFLVSILK